MHFLYRLVWFIKSYIDFYFFFESNPSKWTLFVLWGMNMVETTNNAIDRTHIPIIASRDNPFNYPPSCSWPQFLVNIISQNFNKSLLLCNCVCAKVNIMQLDVHLVSLQDLRPRIIWKLPKSGGARWLPLSERSNYTVYNMIVMCSHILWLV